MSKENKLNYRLERGHGIILPDAEVGLDVSGNVARHIFVSHAHADHLPRDRHMHVYASPATARLMRVRGFQGDVTELAFRQPVEFDRCRVTLWPAGHILGSAMIEVETDAGRVLYTGDYKTPPSPVTEGFACPEATDFFITEATFPLPIYRWRPHEALFAEMRSFASEALGEGYTPVFLGYNLGKAQEIMHGLAPLGVPMQIHGAGYELCRVYEEAGIALGNWEKYDRATVQDGRILITPSSSLDAPMLRNIRRKRVAYVSGWATHESRRVQLTIDKLFPLSDHIDFFELLELTEKLNPRKVYITHTPNPRVVQHYLAERGIASQPLEMEGYEDD